MKILLATDGSNHSNAATETVLARQWPQGTECQVLSVLEPFASFASMMHLEKFAEAHQKWSEDMKQMVSEIVVRLEEKFGKGLAKGLVIEGNPKDVLLETAKAWKADLLVMGSHGDSGLAGSDLGSVTRTVLSHSPCSVEVVKAADLEALVRKADRNLPLEESKFLVALDDSGHSEAVIDSLLNRPWPAESQFQLLHVVEDIHPKGMAVLGNKKELEEHANQAQAAAKAKAEKYLDGVVAKFKSQFPKAKVTHHVLHGNIRSMILQMAQDWPADVIFLGSHGTRGITEYLLGSVPLAVVANASCSVEVIKK